MVQKVKEENTNQKNEWLVAASYNLYEVLLEKNPTANAALT